MSTPSKVIQPALEKISPEFGSSFSIKQYLEPSPLVKQPTWHFHPELELVYVKGGSGQRHIGNHLSSYHNGDLVLIGSMLPHSGFTDRLTGNESETVIHFHQDSLGSDFFKIQEMSDILQLFERAKSGLAFYGEAKEAIGSRVEKVATMDNFAKLIEILCILQDMAWTDEYNILNADGYSFEVNQVDNDRISLVYGYVRTNYLSTITLDEISSLANMTVPAFCRYFKRLSGKTFTRFVNEYRIVHACKMLSEQNESITNICYESGFNNFSHFNRLFKTITGFSPSQYRKRYRLVLQDQ